MLLRWALIVLSFSGGLLRAGGRKKIPAGHASARTIRLSNEQSAQARYWLSVVRLCHFVQMYTTDTFTTNDLRLPGSKHRRDDLFLSLFCRALLFDLITLSEQITSPTITTSEAPDLLLQQLHNCAQRILAPGESERLTAEIEAATTKCMCDISTIVVGVGTFLQMDRQLHEHATTQKKHPIANALALAPPGARAHPEQITYIQEHPKAALYHFTLFLAHTSTELTAMLSTAINSVKHCKKSSWCGAAKFAGLWPLAENLQDYLFGDTKRLEGLLRRIDTILSIIEQQSPQHTAIGDQRKQFADHITQLESIQLCLEKLAETSREVDRTLQYAHHDPELSTLLRFDDTWQQLYVQACQKYASISEDGNAYLNCIPALPARLNATGMTELEVETRARSLKIIDAGQLPSFFAHPDCLTFGLDFQKTCGISLVLELENRMLAFFAENYGRSVDRSVNMVCLDLAARQGRGAIQTLLAIKTISACIELTDTYGTTSKSIDQVYCWIASHLTAHARTARYLGQFDSANDPLCKAYTLACDLSETLAPRQKVYELFERIARHMRCLWRYLSAETKPYEDLLDEQSLKLTLIDFGGQAAY